MAKNWIGREDPLLDEAVVKGEFPSIEGAVKAVTGVTLPFVDAAKGRGLAPLVNNAAVLAEGIGRRMRPHSMPQAENALVSQPQPSADRIRQLRDEYLRRSSAANASRAAQGKSFFPSME